MISSARMSDDTKFICKPTKWFKQRALIMFLMFTGLSGWFFYDAAKGYKNENEKLLMYKMFTGAADVYAAKSKEVGFSKESWKSFVSEQAVKIDEPNLYPTNLINPVKWSPILADASLLENGFKDAWKKYTLERKWGEKEKGPEHLHDARMIREQWIFAIALAVLSVLTLFFWLRTLKRSAWVTDEILHYQDGREVKLADLTQLDLRKWGTKGLAYAKYKKADGTDGKLRLDGFTYGGFDKDQNEPAEEFLRRIKSKFTGELIEYAEEKKEEQPQA